MANLSNTLIKGDLIVKGTDVSDTVFLHKIRLYNSSSNGYYAYLNLFLSESRPLTFSTLVYRFLNNSTSANISYFPLGIRSIAADSNYNEYSYYTGFVSSISSSSIIVAAYLTLNSSTQTLLTFNSCEDTIVTL